MEIDSPHAGDMIPRIKSVMPISDYRLQVEFDDDKEVIYDVKKDIEQTVTVAGFAPFFVEKHQKWHMQIILMGYGIFQMWLLSTDEKKYLFVCEGGNRAWITNWKIEKRE